MTTEPMKLGDANGAMAYYKNLNLGHDVELPLRKSPIRFGVMKRNGQSSNSWRVWGDGKGNFYISARDHMRESKISLHDSGAQHMAFTPESGHTMPNGSRFISQWTQPNYDDGSQLAPSFYLLFPSWALGLTQEIRDAHSDVWLKNQIFVEAAENPMATILSFTITNDDLTVRFNTIGVTPSLPVGVLSLGTGKKLWVVAQHVPEGNMMDLAEQGLRHANAKIDTTLKEKLKGMPSGHVLGMSVSGPAPDGGKYLMLFPGQLHRKEPEGLPGTHTTN